MPVEDFFSEATKNGLISLHAKGFLVGKARSPSWILVVTSASNALITLLETTRVEGLGGVYLAHCPMAFDFKGASWLTTEPAIANPYFGDRMLRCGTIEQTLSQPVDQAAPDSASSPNPGGHNHE